MRKYCIFLLMVLGFNACKKDSSDVGPVEEIRVAYQKGSTSYYKTTTRVLIDYYNTPELDRDETTFDTLSISISEDFKMGLETYFTKTEKNRNYTTILLLTETDSTYNVVARWDDQEQEYVSVKPFVDINKKLQLNSSWTKPFFGRDVLFSVSNFTAANASNKLYICAKVEPNSNNSSSNGKYTYFYDARGLVSSHFQGRFETSYGYLEQTDSIELL
jgi:hypothetical protein